MNETQTKPELKEPETPVNVALDVEDGSRIEVCIQRNTFEQRLVHVYIRDLSSDIDKLLEGAEDLEARVFEGMRTQELKMRFLGLTTSLKPLGDFQRADGCYLLEYKLSEREQIYGAVRRL